MGYAPRRSASTESAFEEYNSARAAFENRIACFEMALQALLRRPEENFLRTVAHEESLEVGIARTRLERSIAALDRSLCPRPPEGQS